MTCVTPPPGCPDFAPTARTRQPPPRKSALPSRSFKWADHVFKLGERVRVRLTPDAHGITWGHFAAEHGAVGEVIGLEQRDDGPRSRVRLPPDARRLATGLVYRQDEREQLDDERSPSEAT
jgi:hypothetical protein